MPGSAARDWTGADGWPGAAVRALLFVGAVYALEQVLRALVAPLVVSDGAAYVLFPLATLLAALLAGGFLLRTVDRRPLAAMGLALSRQVPRELGVGFLAGGAPHLPIVLLLLATGALRYGGDDGGVLAWGASLLQAAGILVVAAAAEEVVYRGYGFQALVRGFGVWPTLLVTSALFAWAHGRNPAITPFALVNIFLAGIVLGLAYLRTLSLWLVTALHLGWNWSMASLFDLPVSGLTFFDTPLYEPVVGGPAWLSGGAFGPEGGLAGSAGLLLALVITMCWPGLSPSAAQLAARPLPARTPDGDENR